MRFRAIERSGAAFGMEVSAEKVARMRKKSFCAEVRIRGYRLPHLMRCVRSEDVAEVMGDGAFLLDGVERFSVGSDLREEYAIIYDDTEYRKIV